MFFQPRCPKCNQPVARNAAFCSSCGERLSGGTRLCGACGAENRGDARFCGKCGQPLDQSAAPEIHGHRWLRPEGDFAIRVEADDLPGLLRRGLKVEPGTNAMLIDRGVNRGILPPGAYDLGNIVQRIADFVTGSIPERVTVLLVDVTPTDLDFSLGGRFTKDPLPIGLTVRVQVEVEAPTRFLVNVLKGRERFSKEDLRQYLYPEVVAVADRWLRSHTLEDLVTDPSQRERLELAIEEALRATFAQTGLRFIQIRTVELNLEPFEAIQGKYARANLIDHELAADLLLAETELRRLEQEARMDAEAETRLAEVKADFELRKAKLELETRKRFEELKQQQMLLDLAEDTRKVEMEERKAELYQRMRQAVMGDRMNEVRSEAEFEKFLDELDRDKLLREKEKADLKQAWAEQAEDHELARRHLLSKLELERNYELRLAALKLQSEYDRMEGAAAQEKLEMEIELARKRADWETELRRREIAVELEVEREKDRLEKERTLAALELERLQREQERSQDEQDAMLGLRILEQMKKIQILVEEEKRRVAREDELARLREQHRLELERMEIEERHRISQREFELRRLQVAGELGAEALVAISGPEQARLLAELKETELLKGMSEEQILARAAERSPEVARALAEKFRAIAEGKASEREKELYERLLADQKQMLTELREIEERQKRETYEMWERSTARTLQSSEHAMDRLAETAQAFAKSQGGQPVIITQPGGTPQVIYTSGTPSPGMPGAQQSGERKTCLNCGKAVPTEARFCEYCGHKFEGVS